MITDSPKSDTITIGSDPMNYYRIRYSDIEFTLNEGGSTQTEDYTLMYCNDSYIIVKGNTSMELTDENQKVLGHKLSEWTFRISGSSGYITFAELKELLNGDSPGPVLIQDARLEPGSFTG